MKRLAAIGDTHGCAKFLFVYSVSEGSVHNKVQ